MKWVRKNKLQKRNPYYGVPKRMNRETGKWEPISEAEADKPYRAYSKWHIAHEKSQYSLGGRVVSLCGTLNLASQDVEVSEDEPKKGKRGYGSSTVCANCAMVWKAIR